MTEIIPQSAPTESASPPRLVLLIGHSASVVSVAYSPDASVLATGSYDGTVILWEAASGRMLRRIPLGWHPDWLIFSPDGSTLATSHSVPIAAVEPFWQNTCKRHGQTVAAKPTGSRLQCSAQISTVEYGSRDPKYPG